MSEEKIFGWTGLDYAKQYLKDIIEILKEEQDFHQLCSGYGAETIEETITNLIRVIEDYQKRNPN